MSLQPLNRNWESEVNAAELQILWIESAPGFTASFDRSLRASPFGTASLSRCATLVEASGVGAA